MKKLKFVPIGMALAAIFAIKLAVLLQLADHPLLQPGGGLDSDYYYQLAQRVAAGDLLLAPGLYFVSPLYIYFLGAFLAAGAGLFAIKLAQIGLGTAACGLVWLTTRAWFGERAAWIALTLAALTGIFTFYEVLILQAALDPFLTALDLWLLTRALKVGQSHLTGGQSHFPPATIRIAWLSPFFLAGLALAVHTLNRPNVLIWAAGLAAALLLRGRDGWRQALALAGGIAIALLPVAARNYAAAGTFTPMPSHGGLNLYIGNNPRADGTYRHVEGITPNIAGQAEDARRVAERAEGRSLTDAEVSAHFTRLALAWMRDNAADATRLFARKVAYTLNATFLTLNYSYPFYSDESRALGALVVGPLLLVPLGIAGILAYRIRGDASPAGYGVFALSVPLLVVSIAVFFAASRYRLPLLVLLCVTSGALLDAITGTLRRRRYPALAAAAAVVIALAALAGRDLDLDDAREEEETRMAVWLAANGRGADAEERLSRLRADHPLLGVAHFRVGQAFERAGRPRDAILHYEQAMNVDPREAAPRAALARASGELGLALARRGEDAEALSHLARAAELSPDAAAAQLNFAVQLARMERFAEARAAASRALRINPEYERARAFLKAIEEAGARR